MTNLIRLIVRAAPVALGLGVAGLAIAATGDAKSEPVRCEIQTSTANGMVTLEGIVHSDVALSGTYQFRVTGSDGGNSSNISQGGYFTAGPEGAVTLGSVMLGGNGANYDASLELMADGKTIACANETI